MCDFGDMKYVNSKKWVSSVTRRLQSFVRFKQCPLKFNNKTYASRKILLKYTDNTAYNNF